MRPLSDLIPLRKTTVWGGFRKDLFIPHRYGITSGELIQYDQARKIFVWSDHASEGIDSVLVNGAEVGGWSWRNGQDTTGSPLTFVEFSSAQTDSDMIIARGRGKLHPSTGGRMTNPASILWDLLANISGNPIAESALDKFRFECDNLGIEVSGNIEESISIQSQARALCSSIGAIFSPDCSGLARIYPIGNFDVARETIDNRFELTCSSERASITNSVTISFDYESGQPKKSIQLNAPDSIAIYGLAERSIEAKWIVSSRVAYDVAVRFLEAYARTAWKVKALGIKRAVRVGDAITVSHSALPYSGAAMILSRIKSFTEGTSDITFEAFSGQTPRTEIVRQSEAFTTNAFAAIGVQTQGTERILTLLEQDGSPIKNASVILDGNVTRYTDTSGKVSFPAALMQPGEHTLEILTTDGRSLTTTVLVQ